MRHHAIAAFSFGSTMRVGPDQTPRCPCVQVHDISLGCHKIAR